MNLRTTTLFCLASCGCGASAEPSQVPEFDSYAISVDGSPAAMISLDANQDGDLDLVVAADDLQILLGDGETFRPEERVDAGPNPGGLVTADFDGDGWPDLAVANHETDMVTVLLGGRGGYSPAPGSPLRPGFSPHPHAVAAGDVDGDGRADLLVDDRDGRAILWLPGQGDGRFGDPRPVPVGGDPYRVMWLGDLSGDGALDLVTPNERDLAVLHGDGSGGFTGIDGSPVRVPRPFAVTAADVNGDGVQDLASIGDEGVAGVTVMLGTADGTYGPAPDSPVGTLEGPGRIVSGDVNGDGFDDLVAGPWPGDSILLVLGGDTGLTAHELTAGVNPWSVVVADFDGDGRLDIATANDGSGDVTVMLNRIRARES